MAKTCPYHGKPLPCPDCKIKKMGEHAYLKVTNPKVSSQTCPYHGKQQPCMDCLKNKMGKFAHKYVPQAPAYVPPHRRGPVHVHQFKKDTCAIACCAMVGINLNCPNHFTLEGLEKYMTERGIYNPGSQSLFHALDYVFKWMGLNCKMLVNVGPKDIAKTVGKNSLVVLEASNHVIVIFRENVDGTLVIGDPAMHKVETNVPANDYRLKGTGRIWEIWK